MSNGGTEKDTSGLHQKDECTTHYDIHRRAYLLGGTKEDRQKADFALFCGLFDAGHEESAIFVYYFFRILGHPICPLKCRWGKNYSWLASNTYTTSTLCRVFMMQCEWIIAMTAQMNEAILNQHKSVKEAFAKHMEHSK